MTVPDLGSERPGAASETREMGERSRTETGAEGMSGRTFVIALVVIVAAIVAFALALR